MQLLKSFAEVCVKTNELILTAILSTEHFYVCDCFFTLFICFIFSPWIYNSLHSKSLQPTEG